MSFLQRFGSALNEHWHYHCCVSDGVFAATDGQTLAFMPATVDVADIVARVQGRVRRRVLAADAAKDMAAWDHGGGFSVDASVGIAADDRPALERLIYLSDKPRPDGSWQVTLTPLELLDRLVRLIPPPSRHLHRYHGVFATRSIHYAAGAAAAACSSSGSSPSVR